MDKYNIHNIWTSGLLEYIYMIIKNIKIVIQKTDQSSTIPVFHLGKISLDIMFWAGGGVEIKSIVYKKERSLYTILGFKTADRNKPLIPEQYQTLKEFIFEIYRTRNSFIPSRFVVKNMTKRITDCLSTNRVWIKKFNVN